GDSRLFPAAQAPPPRGGCAAPGHGGIAQRAGNQTPGNLVCISVGNHVIRLPSWASAAAATALRISEGCLTHAAMMRAPAMALPYPPPHGDRRLASHAP